MKTINLKNILEVDSRGGQALEIFKIRNLDSVKCHEYIDLIKFSENFGSKASYSICAGFYFGLKLRKGISAEFDLLRFSENQVLNIELKHEAIDSERIENQMKRNKFILNQLQKDVLSATYVASEDKIYMLDETEELFIASYEELIDKIDDSYNDMNELENINIDEMLISPYSNPAGFSEHLYFLNDEQMKIRTSILRSESKLFGVVGGPGTGKSILLFDLANKFQSTGENVVVLFCGILSNSELVTSTCNIECIEMKNLKKETLNEYDIIMVDETQRIHQNQYTTICSSSAKKIIFFVDHSQVLHPREEKENMEGYIKKAENGFETYELKYKIRTNPNMSAFIKKFLNKNARNINKQPFNDVSVNYFCNNTSASEYIEFMHSNMNYTPIELTEYIDKLRIKRRKKVYVGSKSVHEVVGREYENIIVVIDNKFFYNNKGLLTSKSENYYPYLEEKSIFEALTRVKKKINIVIIDNEKMYTEIHNLLQWHLN